MLPDPAVAVTVLVTAHWLLTPLGVATMRPAGSVSVNATPVSVADSLELRRTNVRVVVPPTGTLAAPKDLLIVGGLTTVRVSLAVPPGPPSFEVTALVVLSLLPAVVPVTLTMIVHPKGGGSIPPVRVMLPDPAVAVM